VVGCYLRAACGVFYTKVKCYVCRAALRSSFLDAAFANGTVFGFFIGTRLVLGWGACAGTCVHETQRVHVDSHCFDAFSAALRTFRSNAFLEYCTALRKALISGTCVRFCLRSTSELLSIGCSLT
jgi:hypothetical protein